MVKNILQIGETILKTKTKQVVDVNSKETKQIIRDLLDTVIENADISAGLAAPQIGYNKAICICRRVDLEESSTENLPNEKLWEVLINPQILSRSKEYSSEWEACLSIGIGENNIWGPVSRPREVKIEYLTQKGKKKTLNAKGFLSHVVQHEYDHLQGVLFIKYVDNPANLWKLKDLNDYLDKNDHYPEIY